MKKSFWVAGGTGLVGNELIKLMLKSASPENVNLISRHTNEVDMPGTANHIVDFDQLSSFPEKAQVSDIFICLGTTMKKAGSKKAFYAVDFEYVLRVARWAKNSGAESCSVISSIGAASGSSNFYLRTKGEMEEALKDVGFKYLLIFRPSLLLGERKEFRLTEKLSSYIMVLFSGIMFGPLRKYKAVKAEQVAKAMLIGSEMKKEGIHYLENNEILTMS